MDPLECTGDITEQTQTEHSLEVKVRLEYIDTGTAEELFPRFTGEE